ncbi:MAG: mechanosensitive ion channel family protein [Burkholderiales bacterium]
MVSIFRTPQIQELLDTLADPTILRDIGVLLSCLVCAWALVRWIRGRSVDADSIWFGKRIFDGVLFPIAALGLAYGAKAVLLGVVKPAVFKVAIPALLALLVIRLSVRVLSATFPDSRWLRRIERNISWIAWGLMVLWVMGILPSILDAMEEIRWKIGSAHLTLRNVVEGTLTTSVVLMLTLWASSAIEKKLLRGSGDNLSLRKMAANLIRVGLLFIGLMLALSSVGIDLTALSVLSGAVGVGMGLGLQRIAANYVSGFVILAERSLRIGDMVKVDNFEGRISDIRTRFTVIRALNGREAVVPNEILLTQRVENSSLADPKVSLNTVFQIAYGSNVRALQSRLEQEISEVDRVLRDPAPALQLTEFGADGLTMTLLFWISDPENGPGAVKSAVNLKVLDVLSEMGITIPYPQRELHLHSSATKTLNIRALQ